MTFPVFASGDVLNASDMNGVGMWLVKSQAVGSGVASVTVTGAFSSDNDNYLVTYAGGTMSVDTALGMQLGSTTTGYSGNFIYALSTGTVVATANENNTARWTYVGGGANCAVNATIMNPFLARATRVGAPVGYGSTFGNYTGVEASTTSHTAFTLIPFSGTLTGGTIRVYGYRN